MKKSKFLFIMLLIVGVSILTTGCNKESAQGEINSASDKITKIVVASGSSSIPNSYIENGEHKGHEVDIWNAIAKKTGLKVEFITGEFNTLFGYLDSGKADTVGNTITINEKRKEKYNFSEPYAYIPEKVVVHSDRSDITKLKDISGMNCGFSAGSNGGNLFEEIAKEQGIEINMIAYDSSELLWSAFRQGKVDAMILAGAEAAYKIKNDLLDARMVEENIAVGEKAYPFVKNNERSEKLRAIVTKSIQEMKEDGELAQIYQNWYGVDFSSKPADAKIAN
ncbi:transporter substrate-binding domain-containing protein [Halanaerobium salsuginis]|jgi:putative amino-acid transport system substrate-binding protein|uniref:Amino acid ABC transporter substrate-binding protein, PAAT family (TC 3.A.1.3.-) n=1 Tax=Halanaerobium salsuginis TaxID=29563 RepID=A0A1I4FQA6_9FIRM|nr:transporter substrate-binding domain-containing protein [Halanaerobium salsuginis]SFL19649.1 amino acid ABC transporter substrate-binding protein, PAAT family (TC 3.A.1.3.-) [Halanaerobium salsuginis]